MQAYQKQFIDLAIQRQTLKFGEFTLKSGRVSPYFFNAGLFKQGSDLAKLGQYYADTIAESGVEFDVLFGPAYKGIPLAAATATQAYVQHNQEMEYAFNRKEAKDHGEGGVIVGADLKGKRVLVIDDVITAGTAIRESVAILKAYDATLAGVVIALDRQEKGVNCELSAVQEVEAEFDVPVIPIITLNDVIAYCQAQSDWGDILPMIEQYRKNFGI